MTRDVDYPLLISAMRTLIVSTANDRRVLPLELGLRGLSKVTRGRDDGKKVLILSLGSWASVPDPAKGGSRH